MKSSSRQVSSIELTAAVAVPGAPPLEVVGVFAKLRRDSVSGFLGAVDGSS
jgi:hypothetical protein